LIYEEFLKKKPLLSEVLVFLESEAQRIAAEKRAASGAQQ